ncbi:MAG: FMN-binding negative transcriptional regulator [Devosia sp.]
MYQPPAFRETDIATQHDFIAAHPLGFKASQNRAEADRAGVAAGLEHETDPHAQSMRELVKARGGV